MGGQGSGVELEPNPACTGTNEERFQRNTTTFLWDYYDTTNEGMGDSLNEGYWHFLDANSDLLDSTGTNGKDEQWNAAKTAIDEGDGRSLQDFRHMLYNKFGDLNITLYQTHCSPPGDY